jgi:hypothetical protein
LPTVRAKFDRFGEKFGRLVVVVGIVCDGATGGEIDGRLQIVCGATAGQGNEDDGVSHGSMITSWLARGY